MNYILKHTQLEDDGHRSIHIHDVKKDQTLIYYPEEISHVDRQLQEFLFTKLKGINEGDYDT
ncbi:hypothetical protein LF817_16305 [Halobacillus sp. A1]|uniref:hypothetical protein n=1 Tax=Halobacillus sp. A1 TaxID=2880262 RepID=UPI0020A6CBE0|nr:hypothetical protein [Halobacillus sp. A1]MCP3032889.1 hypothetical protein [Halobacillus sp. A1]